MFTRFLLFISIIFSFNAFAGSDRVAVIVNNKVITQKEVYDRKNLIINLNNIQNITEDQHKTLKNTATQNIVDEVLLKIEQEKKEIELSDDEVKEKIKEIEAGNKLPHGYFKNRFSNDKALYESFFNKIKSDILKQKIGTELVARDVSITKEELEDIAIKSGKDATYVYRKFSIDNQSDKSYAEMQKVKSNIKDCKKTPKAKNIQVEHLVNKYSSLSENDKSLLSDLRVRNFTTIIEDSGRIYMYQLCEKTIENLSDKENIGALNYLGNKKIYFRMMRYIENLRKSAYIKYMNG